MLFSSWSFNILCLCSSVQKTVYGANVVIFEGILAFANKELLKVSLLLNLSHWTLYKSLSYHL